MMHHLSKGIFKLIRYTWMHHSFHTNAICFKFLTESEVIHRSVKYGSATYAKRPNDPRVPVNPDFGITYLHRQPKLTENPNDDSLYSSKVKQAQKRNVISKAMQIYLEKANKQNEFMEEQKIEFENGRRHLANMMGLKLETLTQEEIDLSIKYLMPSGLFDFRARPRFKPPSEIYPTLKKAQFSANGRPFHSLFYTGLANFYQICYDLEEELNSLNDYQNDQLIKGNLRPHRDSKINLQTSQWLSHIELKNLILEKISSFKYDNLINALEHLVSHPYAILSKEFLMKFRKEIQTASKMLEIPPLKYDDKGRPYMNAVGRRKYCIAYVTVRGNGTGKVDINGKDILFFKYIQDRLQIMTPLKFCGLLNKVDIECQTTYIESTRKYSEDSPPFPKHVRDLGVSTQSGAIRHGISIALKSFLDKDTVEKMHSVGLLTYDKRVRERKRWGRAGARRGYTWKKR